MLNQSWQPREWLGALGDELLKQRDQWILWLPVPLAVGIGAYFSLKSEPPALMGPSFLILAITLIAPFYRNRVIFYGWFVLFLVILGFTAAQIRTLSVSAPVLQKKTYPLTLEGHVDGIEVLSTSYRVTIDNLRIIDGTNVPAVVPDKVRIKLKNKDPAQPVAGDWVRVRGVLVPPSPPVSPGAYDFERGAFFKGFGSTGYALSDLTVIQHVQGGGFFEMLRQEIRDCVRSKDYFDDNMKGLTLAFLIGDSHAISEDDWETAQKSGIAHLIAISGSHFVLISGIIFFIARAMLASIQHVALRYPIKKISAAIALVGSIFYLFLIGAPIPAQRAAIMTSLIMAAIILDREPLTLRLAAFSAIAILLFRPESLLGASFHLSFAAVVGLIAFFDARRDWWHTISHDAGSFRKVGLFMFASVMTTAVATVCTAPFAFYHFLKMPIVSGVIANMIAVPFSSFITIPFGILACLLMPLHLEDAPLWVTQKSLEYIMLIARDVAAWPDMIYHIRAWPFIYLVPISLGGLWVCIWRGPIRWAGFVPIFVTFALISNTPRPDILLSGDRVRLMAVRDGTGKLWVSEKRAAKFVREAWVERESPEGFDVWPDSGTAFAGDPSLSCEARGCTYQARGKIIYFLKEGADPDNACLSADILVMPFDKKPDNCGASAHPVVIDKWDLYYNAAYNVYLTQNDGVPEIRTVVSERGERPWTGRRRSRRNVQQTYDDSGAEDD